MSDVIAAFSTLFPAVYDPKLMTPIDGTRCVLLTADAPHIHHAMWSSADMAFDTANCWFEFDEVLLWARAPEYAQPKASK